MATSLLEIKREKSTTGDEMNPYDNALKQLQRTADIIGLNPDVYEILKKPKEF